MSWIRFASAYAFRFSGALIALGLLTVSCLAQNGSQGTINVTAVDSTGAVVGGAEVQLKDATTNDTRTAVTGDRGTYTFVNLPIGIYALTVSKTGFDTTSLESVRASAAQVTDLTVTLKIGVTTQVVEIKGESAPVIETTSSAISTTIDMKQIEDLPIVGRDLTSLSYTVPGYTGAFSGLPSIAESNNIDGIIGSTSRMKFTGNSQAVVSPRLEDIQEMTVQTDQLDLGSGYGQANMQINYVTRRGGKTGLLFCSESGSPLSKSNIRNRILYPMLEALAAEKGGSHIFRRFRATWLRKQNAPEDLIRLWLGHGGTTVTDRYVNVEKDKAWRKEHAERIGVGFILPTSVVPNVPKSKDANELKLAA